MSQADEARELPQLDNWVAEFSLTDESDVLDEFTLHEQAKIWGLMRMAWNVARERTAGYVQAEARRDALTEGHLAEQLGQGQIELASQLCENQRQLKELRDGLEAKVKGEAHAKEKAVRSRPA